MAGESGRRLAILGAGAVGRSVAELAGEYGHRVVAIADSTAAATDPDGVDASAVRDRLESGEPIGPAAPEAVFETDYDVLVEATPTTLGDAQPGFDHVRRALEADRHVVLANKGPVAERYDDLRRLERESAGSVRFEATVGGAAPIIATLETLTPEAVTSVRGVLNGTANFVLSRMLADGGGYDRVLATAQDRGIAEADPAFDVEGTDAALKCVILANVLADGGFTLSDADVTGIESVSPDALSRAQADGRTIRLVGEASRDGARVDPQLVPVDGPLAVTGTRNVAQFETRHAGRICTGGPGAGGPETATAVLSDVTRLE